jgi:hypothetical protein
VTAVVRKGEPLPPVRADVSPVNVQRLMEQALQMGEPGIAALERLVKLDADMRAAQAARDFADALGEFQDSCPPVAKTNRVDYVAKSGARVKYDFANLDEIVSTIRPHLRKHGFSFSWDSFLNDPGTIRRTVCILRHRNGHQQAAEFSCPVGGAPSMSEMQKHAGTLTYGERYSLLQVCGIHTEEPDPDEQQADAAKITEDQVTEIRELCAAVQMTPQRLFKVISVGTELTDWDQLVGQPATLYKVAMNVINEKRRKAVAAGGQ